MSVNCHFSNSDDPQSDLAKNPKSRCAGKADSFIRVKHSGRLCPLCAPCKVTFIQAQSSMTDETKKTFPGSGEFLDVDLTPESIDEFLKQPKK
jgi:hypothetical protein